MQVGRDEIVRVAVVTEPASGIDPIPGDGQVVSRVVACGRSKNACNVREAESHHDGDDEQGNAALQHWPAWRSESKHEERRCRDTKERKNGHDNEQQDARQVVLGKGRSNGWPETADGQDRSGPNQGCDGGADDQRKILGSWGHYTGDTDGGDDPECSRRGGEIVNLA